MKYADYEFYTKQYHGQLTEDEFEREIVKSSAYVRRITFGRADNPLLDSKTTEEVKMAACAVCDVRAAEGKKRARYKGRDVVSENNDGYSVSYVQEQQAGDLYEHVLQRKSYTAAEDFLIPTGLLNWEV